MNISNENKFIEHIKNVIKYNINIKDEKGNNFLHIATLKNSFRAVELLTNYNTSIFKYGVPSLDVNTQNKNGDTPLHYIRSLDIANLLLKKGANPNVQNINGDTPLHNIIKYLDNVNNKRGALCYFEILKYKEIINLFLDYDANIYIKNKKGYTYDQMTKNQKFINLIKKNHNDYILFNIDF